jgi:outer membrane receptor protein involved in Fe transport
MHWYGKQRLPSTASNPVEFQRPGYSDPYTLVNAQITIRFANMEVYFGSENILDFKQQEPIIGWQDPFGPHFDTSFAWGPTRGREFYIGLRFKVN